MGPTGHVLYNVPVGETAIVRSATVSNKGPATTPLTLNVGGVTVWSFNVPGLASVELPYMVLDHGDGLTLFVPGGFTVDCCGFGSELEGEAD